MPTPAPYRPPYRHADLARLLNPKSIAILGASPRANSFGDRVLANLADFAGAIYPVNAKYTEIGRHRCYPSLAALPDSPDCVIIVAGREAVEPLVLECAEARAGGVIVCASGYAEIGTPERIAQQARLSEIARTRGLPLVGPNCIGILSSRDHARVTFMVVDPTPAVRQPSIGIISQSGALGFALAQAAARGVGISHILTAGNSCDVDVADYVSFLAEDPACHAIACLFEGMADPTRMMAAAEIAREAGKPLIVFKMATGEEGAAAALSHTGSLAGTQAAYEAAFRQAGAILVANFENLVETAAFFAKAGTARADGVAILATSGGAAIMAADRAEEYGVPLPQPNPEVEAILKSRIPEFGSARNPCDVTAQVLNDPDSMRVCASALLSDPSYAALVVPLVYAYPTAAARMPVYAQVAAEAGKPLVMIWATEHLAGPGLAEAQGSPHVSVFRSVASAFAALKAWTERALPRPSRTRPAIAAGAREEATRLIEQSGAVITEQDAKRILALYGIPVVQERSGASLAEVEAAAAAIGYPVVLKGESPDLPHKTEAGVVRLDIKDIAGLRAAYATIQERAAAHHAALTGVLVQPMVPKGVEIVIGGRADPLFGPLVVVGFGGVLVELLRDTVLAPAPVSAPEAAMLLKRLRGARLLDGFRDLPATDRTRLAEIVSRASVFLADHAARIAELDINPLIAHGAVFRAVDALIVRTRS